MRSYPSPRHADGQTRRRCHRRRRASRPSLDWAAQAIDRGWIITASAAPSPRVIDRRTRKLRRAGMLADLGGAQLAEAMGDWREAAGARS